MTSYTCDTAARAATMLLKKIVQAGTTRTILFYHPNTIERGNAYIHLWLFIDHCGREAYFRNLGLHGVPWSALWALALVA